MRNVYVMGIFDLIKVFLSTVRTWIPYKAVDFYSITSLQSIELEAGRASEKVFATLSLLFVSL